MSVEHYKHLAVIVRLTGRLLTSQGESGYLDVTLLSASEDVIIMIGCGPCNYGTAQSGIQSRVCRRLSQVFSRCQAAHSVTNQVEAQCNLSHLVAGVSQI